MEKSSVKNIDEKYDVIKKIGFMELFCTELIETGTLPDNGSNMAVVSKVNTEKCTGKIEKNSVEMVANIEEAEMPLER